MYIFNFYQKEKYILGSFFAIGLCISILLACRLWIPAAIIISIIALIPLVLVASKQPDALIFISILLNFSPVGRNIGFYFILLTALVIFARNFVKGRRIIIFDNTVLLWLTFVILSLASFAKWTSIYRGFRGAMSLFIIPMLLHVIINHGYIDKKAKDRFFSYYFPLINTYIVLQILYLVVTGTAVTGYSYVEFHTGFRLVWGGTVFIAALCMFFTVLMYQTRLYWVKNPIIKILVYINIIVNICCITLIMARAPILSLLCAIGFHIFFTKLFIKQEMKTQITFILIFLLLVASLYLLFGKYLNHLVYRFINMKSDLSFLVRIYMYSQGLYAFKQNYIVGAGPDQYIYQDFVSKVTDPNNIFISYGVSFGIFGLIAIIVILLKPYYFVFKYYIVKKELKNIFALQLLPVLTLAIINSCLEVIVTSFSYGSLFWTTYALFYSTYDHKYSNQENTI